MSNKYPNNESCYLPVPTWACDILLYITGITLDTGDGVQQTGIYNPGKYLTDLHPDIIWQPSPSTNVTRCLN